MQRASAPHVSLVHVRSVLKQELTSDQRALMEIHIHLFLPLDSEKESSESAVQKLFPSHPCHGLDERRVSVLLAGSVDVSTMS